MPVIFPANPFEFKSLGLLRNPPYQTPNNGLIIKWMDSAGDTIFEWDEDFKYGPHYHILHNNKHVGDHRLAGQEVPEPYASLYFPSY